MFTDLAQILYSQATAPKRFETQMPPWSIWVFLADFIIIFPVLIILAYTFNFIYPTLAIVEDENPPAYEPVPLAEDAAEDAADPARVTDGKPQTVTSSLRATRRLLYANGGFRSHFRGFLCILAQVLATWMLLGIFSRFLPTMIAGPVAVLLASLALVQLSTAWVHIVISQQSPLPFWKRLPPFKRTFDATHRAVLLYWAATQSGTLVITLLSMALTFSGRFGRGSGRDGPADDVQPTIGDLWSGPVILIVGLAWEVFVLIPAHVILVRVQASLLPVEDDTIIPFDRSFEGKVQPVVVDGKGYVSITDAWKTFSRAAWRRLIILYLKIFAVWVAFWILISVVLVPEMIVIMKHSTTREVGGN